MFADHAEAESARRRCCLRQLCEYFGLVVFFYSSEHEPVHVYDRYQDRESRAEIVVGCNSSKIVILSLRRISVIRLAAI
jgi:hypothetical protein